MMHSSGLGSWRVSAAIWALALASIAGCSDIAVRLGLRIRLDNVPVTAVSASLVGKNESVVTALGPGQSGRLVLVATTQDGKQLATVGAGNGKVSFDNYTIQATIVHLTKRDVVSLSSDPRESDGKIPHLHIFPTAHPDIVAELDIPVRYDFPFVANYSGADGGNGTDGINGLDGMPGSDGTPGTVDPTTGAIGPQGPGGRGSDGASGGDGADGKDGAPGSSVHVWIRLRSGEKPLLQVKAVSGDRASFYLVDPSGGSLKITADGGSGGRGGTGGRGGHGGSGGNGSPNGFRGVDGRPGFDGHAGKDGAAGTISISVDPAAQPFLSYISWSNHSGRGSPGPAPTIAVEAVPPLW